MKSLILLLAVNAGAVAIPINVQVVDQLYKLDATRPTEEELTGVWITHAGFINKDTEIEYLDAGSCEAAATHQTAEFGRMQLGKLGRMLAAKTGGKTTMVLTLKDAIEAQLPGKTTCKLIGGVEGSMICKSPEGYKAWVKLRASCSEPQPQPAP